MNNFDIHAELTEEQQDDANDLFLKVINYFDYMDDYEVGALDFSQWEEIALKLAEIAVAAIL